MRLNILLVLFLTIQMAYGQGVCKKVQKIVDEIAQEKIYTSSLVGYAGKRTKQWQRFEKLRKKATDRELIALTKHESPVVKCYSFQALAERGNSEIFDILLNHLRDNDEIETLQGCIMSSQLVGDFFLDVVSPNYISLDGYKLNDHQRNTVDSLLLFDENNKLVARSSLLERIKPKEEYYNRIKEVYSKEKRPAALIAISKYKKEKDIALISEWLAKEESMSRYYGLRAARYFPHPDFFPHVKSIHEKEIRRKHSYNYRLIRMLYLAIVQYKDDKSRELIEIGLDVTRSMTMDYHHRHIWLALTKYPDPIYEGLKEKVRISELEKDELRVWLDRSE